MNTLGPETVDRALIGTIRQVNTVTNTIDFTRFANNGSKQAVAENDQRESVIYRLHPELEGRKLIFQIGTASPDLAVQAASLIAADVAGIDVNAGCPKPFSTLGGMGAALLKTPDKLCDILRALIEKVGTPHQIGISVKIRILDTPEATRALVERLVATGITGLTVHCRTTPMRPRERAIRDQLPMVASICRSAGVACLMNGDVTSRDEALALAAEYGADGAMIAAAAETNPSCFRAGPSPLLPWQDVVNDYVALSLKVDNRWGNTKYLLGQMIPGRSPLYNQMKQAKSYARIVEVLGLTDTLGDTAAHVDRRLGLDVYAAAVEGAKLSKAERKARVRAEQDAAQRRKAEAAAGAKKRSADEAGLDAREETLSVDQRRDAGPGSVPEHAAVLAV